MIYYSRRNRLSQYLKKRKYELCPNCGHRSEIIEQRDDAIIYKCKNESCRATNIFTFSPAELRERKRKKNKNEKPALVKLRDKSKGRSENRKEKKSPEDQKGEEPNQKGSPVLRIRDGMEKQRLISFQYVSNDGKKSQRLIEPYKLERDSDGRIILWAYCTDSEGIRKFVLSKISNMKLQKYNFDPRWPIEDKLQE